MTKSSKARTSSSRKPEAIAEAKVAPALVQAPPSPRPGGKLGVIIDRLAGTSGATADELVAATGWQRHSVLGALSRLRSRGFAMRFDDQAERKAYRLDVTAKPDPQSRARG
mgnify:CR=1 FL=1